ncbi:ribose transport system permease protein [Paracoccus pantotrophus]|nr:ribose transport system permease protein [Paracoccus pantotrophus]
MNMTTFSFQGPMTAMRATWHQQGIAISLITASIVFYALTAVVTGQYSHVSFAGFLGLFERTVTLSLVAMGQAVVIAGGAIDLSVANIVSVAAVLAAYFMQNDPGNIAEATVMVIAICGSVGVLNGLLVTLLRVSPLIATLGTSLVLQGILSLSYGALQGTVPKAFQVVAYGKLGGVPVSLLSLLTIALLTAFVLQRTRAGSRLLAVGGNPRAARLAGIHGSRVTVATFAFSAVMSALAGLYLASRLGTGTPWIGRDGSYDLSSIAAAVIGGTLLSGGRISIAGTLAGVLVFAATDAIFNMLQIDPFLSQVLRGVIVIAAVASYTYRSREEAA